MGKTLLIHQYVDDVKIYETGYFEFNPGVTVLLGCNGSGKTTLLRSVENYIRRIEGLPTYWYDIRKADSVLSARASMGRGTPDYLLSNFLSEGEKIKNHLDRLVVELGWEVQSHENDPEMWIFFDSLDSGWSIDNCKEFELFLNEFMIPTKPEGMEMYVLMAVNSYDFAKVPEWDRIDVQTAEHLPPFESYEDYSDYIMATRKRKNDIWE